MKDWRAIPYVEMDATLDKDLMFFGDLDDVAARRAYERRVRAVVDGRLGNEPDQGELFDAPPHPARGEERP